MIAGILACLTFGGGLMSPAPLQVRAEPDPLVDSLVMLVLQSHPSLKALRAKVRAADARPAAAAGVSPGVLALEIEEVPEGAQVWRAGQAKVTLEVELLAGPRRSARRQLAAAEAATARARLVATERVMDAALRIQLLEWLAAETVADRLALEDSLLQEAEETITARFAVASTGYVEVLRVRAERLRVQTERSAAVAEAGQARLGIVGWLLPDSSAARSGTDLLSRLGRDPAARLALSRLPAPPPPEVPPELEMVRSIRASLIHQGERLRALARAETQPAVTGFAGLQRFEDSLNNGRLGVTAGIRLSLPFTAGGQNRASVNAAQLEADALADEGTALAAWFARQIAQLRERYLAERARALVYQSALLGDLRAERDAALAAYRNGSVTLFELLDFERALVRAEIDQVTSVRSALVTWYRLSSGVPAELAEELLVGGAP